MLRNIARRAGVGRVLYHSWHAPRGAFKRLRNEGAFNLFLAQLGKAEMERAAERLRPLPAPAADAAEIYYLSGQKFAYQTAFCAASFGRHARKAMRVVVVDDGTLSDAKANLLHHVFPGLKLIGKAEVTESLEARLPVRNYPELRRRRLVYPHLRKLTDVHTLGDGWKLVLDSDMLFHDKPDFLIHWLNAPDRPCHLVDVANAYGYSSRLLCELAGCKLPQRVNVGVCGLNSGALDWDKLEYWCQRMIACEGSHYLMEQALVAMLMAGKQCAVAPVDQYKVAPSREEVARPTAVLHHYTAESKAWYFRLGWRHVIGNQDI